MSQSPTNKNTSTTQNQGLIKSIAAEDAASSEVSCGEVANGNFLDIITSQSINIDNENLRNLLRNNLGHLLSEVDFDFIISKIHRYISRIISSTNLDKQNIQSADEIVEHIPSEELRQLLQLELQQYLSVDDIAATVKYTQYVIHSTVLQPRNSWLPPIWILQSEKKFYIAQTTNLEEAIALIKAQYPQGTESLELVKVSGILAPNQVTVLDIQEN